MTRNIQEYWRAVRAIEQALPDFVWLTAAGRVIQVGRAIAARLIREGSHKEATDEEVAVHLSAEAERNREARRKEKARHGQAVIVVEK